MSLGFKVKSTPVVGMSPARALAYEGVNELMQEGLSHQELLDVPVNCAAVYAVAAVDGDVVGVVCYSVSELLGTADVRLLYVEPSSRREGVATALWSALLDELRGIGVSVVTAPVHSANTAARALARKVGGQERAVVYDFSVAPGKGEPA